MPRDIPRDLIDVFNHFGDPSTLREDELPLIRECPLLPVRDQVIFPRVISPLFEDRNLAVKAIEAAYAADRRLIVVAQHDPDVEEPGLEDLYSVGTEVQIARVLRMPDGTTSVLVQGRRRVRIDELVQTLPHPVVKAMTLSEPEVRPTNVEALMRAVLALFEKCAQLSRTISEESYVFAMNISEPGWLADMVASSLDLKLAERQEVLEELNAEARLKRLSIFLARELDVLELEDRIHSLVQQEVDHSQREFFLREQMRVIQDELGEGDTYTQEIDQLRESILESDMPEPVRDKALHEAERLAAMPPLSPETGIIRSYLDCLLDLPWSKTSEDNLDIRRAGEELESSHYGLLRAKERILEHIAVRKLAADKMRSPILCFVGPPGTGKTSLGKSIARALGRTFVRVSLGGIHDEAEIRGHRRTYIGAMPGRIIQIMRQAETVNPVFMLDEIDKLGVDFRGDPSAALLEALDPEQNYAFSDHYLDVPYDLSKVMFITTANILNPVPPALQDRMEVIEFPGYIEEEKLEIAHRFLVPKQLEEHGLQNRPVAFPDETIRTMIREYTYEAGVRNLEREIAKICRKLARRVAEAKSCPHQVNVKSLTRYLGPPEFEPWKGLPRDEIGVATGVAWTEGGGDLMPIEVALMDGKGNLTLTGQLGEIMQESAQAALSYVRSYLGRMPGDDEQPDFDKLDIHIHVPEGAIPKDGPSAGIALATALLSALTGRPVRRSVAMTGEITLRGRVLAVGGLKEKAMTAHRAGIEVFVLPKPNEKDMVDIPSRVRRDMSFVFVESMDKVLEQALLAPIEGQRPITRDEPEGG
jgi:ATP-dependent Lon protease